MSASISLSPGSAVVVYGHRAATVVSTHGGGKKVLVEYEGGKKSFVKASELKEV